MPSQVGPTRIPAFASVARLCESSSNPSTFGYIRAHTSTSDRAKYVASQKEAVKFPSGQTGNVPSKVTLGPAYFESFPNIPNARYTLSIPLATHNLTNAVEFAKAGFSAFRSQIEFLEIGNEPNSYPGTVRSQSYAPHDYINEFTEFSDAVNSAVGLASDKRIYQAIALLSPPGYEHSDDPVAPGAWYPNALFGDGLSKLAPRFGAVSMH